MISPIPPTAERQAYLLLIETLQAELLQARTENANLRTGLDATLAELEHVRLRVERILAEPEELSRKAGRRFEIDALRGFRTWVE